MILGKRPHPLPVSAPRPMPGTGTLLTRRGDTFAYNGAPAGAVWVHPFRASLAGYLVRIGDGRVDGLMPTIDGQRMTETALNLRRDLAPPVNGETWVCVEVTPTQAREDGPFIIDPKRPGSLVIRHRSEPTTQDATTGRHPLACLVWEGGQPLMLIQSQFFNLRYRRIERGNRIDHDFA